VIIGTSASDCVLSSQLRSNVISRHSESAVDMLVKYPRNRPVQTLRNADDTPCDLDIHYIKASKREHQRCEDNPGRKVTPMLPESTIPKLSVAPPAVSGPWVMTPLFSPPTSTGPETNPARPPGRRAAPRTRRASHRANSLSLVGQPNRSPESGETAAGKGNSGPGKDTADLLAVTVERLQRALMRSFLRYNIPGDLDIAVHAAINVVEPVLDARDREILRLRSLITAKIPSR